MEIGEGNSLTVITVSLTCYQTRFYFSLSISRRQVIRRSRWLRKDHYKAIHPEPDEQGADLDAKWRLWVDQESKKR
jgi:hypothetical protein